MRKYSGPFSYKTLMDAYLLSCVSDWTIRPSEIHGNVATVIRCIDYLFEGETFPSRIKFQDAEFIINNSIETGVLVLKSVRREGDLVTSVLSLDMEVTFTE